MKKDQIITEAREFCTKHAIKAGWSQKQHVGFQISTIIAMLGIEGVEDQKELVEILTLTCNPSAFRQTMESAGVLVKGENKAASDAEALLAEYAK